MGQALNRINQKFFHIAFVVTFIVSGSCLADDSIVIVKSTGKVTVQESGRKDRAVGTKSILPAKNTLTTGPDGRAVVRVGETGYVVLEKNSRIDLEKKSDHAGFFRQLTGMIYYAINALHGKQNKHVQVITSTGTIGIRGTRFLVTDESDRKEIGMRKGEVNVTSPDTDYEIHRKSEQDEFEAFKQEGRDAIAKQRREFEEYKAKAAKEFIEYKREFTLGANRMVSFDGKRVEDKPLSKETEADMGSLEEFSKEWIEQVKD